MKKILVFGTFDIFHEGHGDFLKQARGYGDYLKVVVARDRTVEEVKNESPLNNEKRRMQAVKESGLADEVALGNLGDKFEIIMEYGPDVICLGYDQEYFVGELDMKLGEFGLSGTKIVRLEPFEPQKYKSSILKSKFK